jgi:hypothetical protein
MAAPLLYTALTDLEVRSLFASWPCKAGMVLPLNPDAYPTKLLLDNGSIEPAPPDAADTCTPPHVLRGIPGLHVGVSN